MTRKPISPDMHGLIDYGFGVLNTVGPAALGLTGSARTAPAVAAVVQGTLNALSNQRYAAKRIVPFRAHGKLEAAGVPALLVASIVTEAWKQPKAPVFYAGQFLALGTVYTLTDWNGQTAPG